MTKVSWKRILQRAGNDFPPHHGGRAFPETARPQQQAARPPRPTEPPSVIAGELETELRRALQRSQMGHGREPEAQAWDQGFVAREVRHTPPAVPVANYRELEARNRSASGGTRNLIVASLSAAVIGFGAYQIGWGGGGGGGSGGGNGGGNDDTPLQSASAAAPIRVVEQGKRIDTGYSIQPMLQTATPTDLAPIKEPASLAGDRAPVETAASDDAAAAFKRDMEEAVRLFEDKQATAAAAAAAPRQAPDIEAAERQIALTEKPTRAAPAPAPTRTASVAPAETAERPSANGSPRASVGAATASRAEPPLAGPEEDQLLQRASALMKRGDVTGARLLFEHLALRGSALGAFALAQSFDPRHLNKIYVRGLTGDQKQADYWYRRAAELGGNVSRR